jgi:hypothetical protein
MTLKLKALTLGTMACTAVACLAVMNASATTGGHFVSEVEHTIVNQTTGIGPHALRFVQHTGGFEGSIVCDEMTATGTATTATVTSELGSAVAHKCHTQGSEILFQTDMNGCQTRITVAAGDPAKTEQTNDIVCPAGKAIEITHPNCTITIPPQSLAGITYTRILDNGKHAITADVNSQLNIQYHAGFCVFVGTSHTGTFQGSTIVRAFNTAGSQISFTAT